MDSIPITRIHQYYFHNPLGQRKITHLAVLSFNNSCNISCCLPASRGQNLEGKSYGNGKIGSRTYKISNASKSEEILSGKQSPWLKFVSGSNKFKSIILLNFITLVHASNMPVVKEVEGFMDPAAFSVMRFAVSAIPFIPSVIQARNDIQTRNAGLELGLWISLGYLIEAIGLLTSDVGRASFISLFTVIIIPLLESMLGEIVPARTWFGISMSVLGIAMLECSGSPPNIGDLFNFLSAIFYGIHTLRTEQISRTTRKENFLALLGYEVCVVAILSTMWCLIGGNIFGTRDNNDSSWTWSLFWDWIIAFPWIPALYTGVFSTGFCLWGEVIAAIILISQIAAMRNVSATETAVIYGLEPVWGAGFAWFLLGERWGIAGWIGAALVLGGSLMVQILGASPCESRDIMDDNIDADLLRVSDNKKLTSTLSANPVIIRSRENVVDRLKK